MGKTLVTILNHNQPKITDDLYSMLEKYYDVVIVDNGSKKENFSKDTKLWLKENRFFGGALNEIISYMLEKDEYDSLLFLNNDLILHGYNFVEALRAGLDQGFDLVSPCIIQPHGDQCA
jgi:GT2 family glycosyltransferase